MIDGLHAGAVRGFLEANAIDPAAIDVIGFHGQTVLHRPEDRLTVQIGDGPGACRRNRHPGGVRPARRGCRGRRAGRAAGAGLSPRAGGDAGAAASDRGAQCRRRRQCHLHRRRARPVCLRYRARQCADRRLHARAHGAMPRREWAGGGTRPCRRGGGRAGAPAFLLRAEAAEIARSQCLPRMGDRARAARGRRASRMARRRSRPSPRRRSRPSCRICRSRRKAGSSAAAAPATPR